MFIDKASFPPAQVKSTRNVHLQIDNFRLARLRNLQLKPLSHLSSLVSPANRPNNLFFNKILYVVQ
jgi:hypothetical protein